MKRNHLLVVITLLLCTLITGCSFDETEKANKLVDTANTAIKDANDKNERGTTNLVDMEKAIPDLGSEADLERLRSKAKDIIADLEKARDGYKEAGSKFDEASKLDVKAKFKEYLSFKSKEMNTRSDMATAVISEPKALIDSKGPDEYQKKIDGLLTKVTGLRKDAEDLAGKADKIFEENKDLFKSDSGK
jgi:peptidoglycan hydrolase CwlO-like protein